MYQVADPRTLEVVSPVFSASYLLWATLWGLVAFHYGRAAYASWKLAGGRWGGALADVAAPFSWALRNALCKMRVLRGAPFCAPEIPSKYYRGHLLRFAIFLGSLCPVLWGFYYVRLDRSSWSYADLLVNFAGLIFSGLAAGSHLFLAYKSQPDAWTRLVALCVVWMVLAPAVFSAVGFY